MSNGAITVLDYSKEQCDLIARTICKGATPDELALFLGQCRRTGLDPFSRQIHAVKRKDKKEGREVMTIQVGIDGFRLIAERTGESDGQDGPYWCGQDGKWVDVWLSKEHPFAAKVLAYRKGCSRAYSGLAHWAEYAQTYADGNLLHFWSRMPAIMLAKCAESLALRKAFPQELSGLYTPDEIRNEDAEVVQPERQQIEHKPAEPANARLNPTEKESLSHLLEQAGIAKEKWPGWLAARPGEQFQVAVRKLRKIIGRKAIEAGKVASQAESVPNAKPKGATKAQLASIAQLIAKLQLDAEYVAHWLTQEFAVAQLELLTEEQASLFQNALEDQEVQDEYLQQHPEEVPQEEEAVP